MAKDEVKNRMGLRLPEGEEGMPPAPTKSDNEVQNQSQATGSELTTVDFGDDAGKGMQNLSLDEYRIPFVRILDAKSPQVAPPPHGLMGAKAGDFFNIATGEIIDGPKGFTFVPCYRDHNFVEWKKRNPSGGGGGFVKTLDVDDPQVLKLRAEQGRFKKLQLTGRSADGMADEAHEIAEGFYLYGILVDPAGFESRIILPFTGMQIKKYNAFIDRYDAIKYMTPRGTIKPPLWAHKFHVRSIYETRGDQSWYGYVISFAAKDADGRELPPVKSLMGRTDPLYQFAAKTYDLIASGKAHADYSTADREPGDDEDALNDPPM